MLALPRYVAFFLLIMVPAGALELDDILVADFERDTWLRWETSGKAFGDGPAVFEKADSKTNRAASSRFSKSAKRAARNKGQLISPRFQIARDYLVLQTAGGLADGKGPNAKLLLEDKPVRLCGGSGSDIFSAQVWDVRDLKGKYVRIQLDDQINSVREGNLGWIAVDDIVQTNKPPYSMDRLEVAKLSAERPKRQEGDLRPMYHATLGKGWLGPVTGAIIDPSYRNNNLNWHTLALGNPRNKVPELKAVFPFFTHKFTSWQQRPEILFPDQKRGVTSFNSAVVGGWDGRVVGFNVGQTADGSTTASYSRLHNKLEKLVQYPAPNLKFEIRGKALVNPRPTLFCRGPMRLIVVAQDRRNRRLAGVHLFKYSTEDYSDVSYVGTVSNRGGTQASMANMGERTLLVLDDKYYCGRLDPSTWDFSIETSGIFSASPYSSRGVFVENWHRSPGFSSSISDPNPGQILKDEPWSGAIAMTRFVTWNNVVQDIQQHFPKEVGLLQKDYRKIEGTNLKDGKEVVFEDWTGDTARTRLFFQPEIGAEVQIFLQCSQGRRDGLRLQVADGEVSLSGLNTPRYSFPIKRLHEGSYALDLYLDGAILEGRTNHGFGPHFATFFEPRKGNYDMVIRARKGSVKLDRIERWAMKH